MQAKADPKQGDMILARYIKSVPSKGVSVQIAANKLAYVDVTEITDELQPNVYSVLKT